MNEWSIGPVYVKRMTGNVGFYNISYIHSNARTILHITSAQNTFPKERLTFTSFKQ